MDKGEKNNEEKHENVYEKLAYIQSKLKAPKGQYNEYSKFYYRSCEDILEAVKPLLAETGTVLTLTDDIVNIGGRFYVKAVAKLACINGGYFAGEVYNVAYAREDEAKKGMDASQITGSCSSYARKYAMNGLFLIDDTKEVDSMNHHEDTQSKTEAPKKTKAKEEPKPEAKKPEEDLNRRITKEELQAIIAGCKENGVDVAKICRLYKKESLPELSLHQFKNIMKNWEKIKRAE